MDDKLNLEHLSSEELMDMHTPSIFVPRDRSKLRLEVLRTNAEIERVLAQRGIRREASGGRPEVEPAPAHVHAYPELGRRVGPGLVFTCSCGKKIVR